MYKAFRTLSIINLVLGVTLIILPVAYLVVINTPQIWYAINPDALNAEVRALTKDPLTPELQAQEDERAAQAATITESETNLSGVTTNTALVTDFKPPFDSTLPTINQLIIPRLSLDGPIYEGSDAGTLEKGIWLMPGFGDPEKYYQTTILAAHRWGSVYLPQDYREKNLFYNLPQLLIGDEVDINWNQRLYKYKVEYKEENNYVSRLDDLVLITCKFFDSDQRIIVYASRIN